VFLVEVAGEYIASCRNTQNMADLADFPERLAVILRRATHQKTSSGSFLAVIAPPATPKHVAHLGLAISIIARVSASEASSVDLRMALQADGA
jgi:hypothetical protein